MMTIMFNEMEREKNFEQEAELYRTLRRYTDGINDEIRVYEEQQSALAVEQAAIASTIMNLDANRRTLRATMSFLKEQKEKKQACRSRISEKA